MVRNIGTAHERPTDDRAEKADQRRNKDVDAESSSSEQRSTESCSSCRPPGEDRDTKEMRSRMDAEGPGGP